MAGIITGLKNINGIIGRFITTREYIKLILNALIIKAFIFIIIYRALFNLLKKINKLLNLPAFIFYLLSN